MRAALFEFAKFASGAVADPNGPTVSIAPSQRSCRLTPSAFARTALARSISRGKSMSHSWGGVYGQWLKHSLHCQHRSTIRRKSAGTSLSTSPSWASTRSSMVSKEGQRR
jgi:hypothetical protein